MCRGEIGERRAENCQLRRFGVALRFEATDEALQEAGGSIELIQQFFGRHREPSVLGEIDCRADFAERTSGDPKMPESREGGPDSVALGDVERNGVCGTSELICEGKSLIIWKCRGVGAYESNHDASGLVGEQVSE